MSESAESVRRLMCRVGRGDRLGMHLLFYGGTQIKLLRNQSVETVLKNLSIRVCTISKSSLLSLHRLIDSQQGNNYDSDESVKNIPSFIDTYSIQTDELLEPDITKYKTFNEFFYRKLKPDARPVQNEEDPKQVCSAADSRVTVYESVSLAKQFWCVYLTNQNMNISK